MSKKIDIEKRYAPLLRRLEDDLCVFAVKGDWANFHEVVNLFMGAMQKAEQKCVSGLVQKAADDLQKRLRGE